MIGKRDLSQNLLERFVQLEPYKVCNRGVKVCRDPRCSWACRHRWAAQQRAAIVQLFVDLDPPAMFAGNLSLHRLANVDEHRQARKAFMRCLRECCRKEELPLKVRCFTHAARKDSKGRSWFPGVGASDLIYGNVHYDFVAYSTTKATLKLVGDIPMPKNITMAQQVATARRTAAAPPIEDDTDDEFLPYCPHCRAGVPLNQIDYGDGEDWYLCNMCGNLYKDDEVFWDDSDDPFDDEDLA